MEELAGRVAAFDERRGLGEVESERGERFQFHCTAIADGTRTVPVDARVVFTPVPGPIGGFEAGRIRTVAA
jgi:cold shock CspA family protein